MGYRRRSREIALQVLFQREFTDSIEIQQALDIYLENFEASADIKEFAELLTRGVWENVKELDSIIQSNSQNWKVGRMAFVDKNILRVAVYELKFLSDKVPTNVVLDEAVEIAKRFGSQDSSAFINGLLDKISKSLHQ